MESRESLNDSYREHSLSSQEDALDAEASAYETAMTKMVDGMRVSLEEATADMASFLDSVTIAVSMNADTVLAKYRETEVPLNDAITNPWEEAAKKVGQYGDDAKNLMDVWKKGGYFAEFKSEAGINLSSPWSAGTAAANSFKSSVSTVMSGVVSNIATNVKSASGELSKLYQQIKDTEARAASASVAVNTSGSGGGGGGNPPEKPGLHEVGKTTSASTYWTWDAGKQTKNTTTTVNGKAYLYVASQGAYYPISGINPFRTHAGPSGQRDEGYTFKKGTPYYKFYAKGTTGTSRDEWAITDEFGPELKMYATPEGNLSFMALGSTVVPHDLTMDLIELPDVVDDLMNMSRFDSGINIISNAINKPEIIIDVENFLKVDRVDKDTLPQLEAMMDKKIDTFAKQLNYSIKRFAR